MAFFFTVLLTLLAIEYLLRIPFLSRSQAVIHLLEKIVHTLQSSAISDHWKEKALIRYARMLMLDSVALFFMLTGCVLLVGGTAFIIDQTFVPDPATMEVISSLPGIIIMTVVSALYIYFRNRYIDE